MKRGSCRLFCFTMGGCLLALSGSALAQEIPTTGQIAGRVVSTSTGRPLPFANVILFKLASEQDTLGTQITGTFSLSPEGNYRLNAGPGLYRVLASHISHAHVNFTGIEIVAGKTTPLDILLSPATTMTLQAIRVRAKVERRTEAAVLTRRKEAEVVSDAVSIEQIKKTADSNAADALQRVSGLSLVDDKYVFVRGLGERYSSTQINGSTVGSPEPNKRVLPLDMIPAVLIDNMEILKTYMPDQPAEFGGGVVKINTRDFPGKRIWAISVGSGAIVGTTGGPFHAYDGGKLDFLGFDDGTRALPDLIDQWAPDRRISFWSPLSGKGFKPDQIAALGQSFSRVWATQSRSVWPAYKVNGAYGDQFSIGGNPLGFIVGGIWANTFDTYDEVQRHYKPGAEEGTLQILSDYDATTSRAKAHLGMVGSLNYRAGENTGIYFRTLYNHQAEDDARCYEGPNDDHGKYMRNTRLRFIERGLWASSLGITHDFPQLYGGRFEWRVNYSQATRDEPDRRQYTYERHGSDQAGYSWQLSNRSLAGGFTRMFGVLDERERGAELSWTMPLFLGGESEGRLKLGYFGSFKNRESTYRRFAFKPPSQHAPDMSMPPDSLMTEELIGGTKDTFRIVEQTQGTDHYEARVDINAVYLVLHVPLSRRLRAAGGVRVESWDQAVKTFDPFNSAQPPVVAMLGETDYLPALNLTYTVNPKMNLRAGYSATISRPDIRELTPFEMHDWESGYSEVGNPELRRARIQNFDLRLENFPEIGEVLAVSLFYKDLTDPIEKTLHIAGSQLRQFPMNGDGGYLYGTELEARIALRRLTHGLRSLSLASNITLVKSQTKLPEVYGQISNMRTLQGQSPYIINLLVFFSPEMKPYALTVTYNMFAKRLSGVGAFQLPHIYELARQSLDITATLHVGRTKFKFSTVNLLDAPTTFTQLGYVVSERRDGRAFKLSMSWDS